MSDEKCQVCGVISCRPEFHPRHEGYKKRISALEQQLAECEEALRNSTIIKVETTCSLARQEYFAKWGAEMNQRVRMGMEELLHRNDELEAENAANIRERNLTAEENSRLKCELDEAYKDNAKIKTECDRYATALKIYADKKNWKRNEAGTLRIYLMDTNGPYAAFTALREGGGDES
jgi:cysteine synthase